MITPSFGLTATERVLPKLALDFTTASLDSRVTFTRTTGASNPATYVNSSGVITLATNNEARFDYAPLTLVCKGLLIEEARTNLILQSQDFSTTWTNVNSTESTDAVNSPDGTQNADKLEETNATGNHTLQQSLVIDLTSANHTFSCFIKAAERTRGRISFFRTAGAFPQILANFDLTAKTISASGVNGATYLAGSAFIQEYPNGWFRIGVTGYTGQSGNHVFDIYTANSTGSVSFAGTTGDGFYLWGAQLEAGAFATSYIPTTTAALTRNGDEVSMTGTNFTDWFNASEGTLEAQYIKNAASAATSPAMFFSPTVAQGVSIWINTDGINTRLWVGATNAVLGTGVLGTQTTAAITYGSTKGGALNGGNFVSNAGTIPADINSLLIGKYTSGYFNGYVQKINYWPHRLTDNEVKAFSK